MGVAQAIFIVADSAEFVSHAVEFMVFDRAVVAGLGQATPAQR
jgi:hypothetical protein